MLGPARLFLEPKHMSLRNLFIILKLALDIFANLMLLTQFSIVLCYQPEFYVKCLEHVAITMIMIAQEDEPAIKSICTQIIVNLFNIDTELLEQGVNKLDFTKKTPIRKVMIEHENLSQRHKNLQVLNGN